MGHWWTGKGHLWTREEAGLTADRKEAGSPADRKIGRVICGQGKRSGPLLTGAGNEAGSPADKRSSSLQTREETGSVAIIERSQNGEFRQIEVKLQVLKNHQIEF